MTAYAQRREVFESRDRVYTLTKAGDSRATEEFGGLSNDKKQTNNIWGIDGDPTERETGFGSEEL